MTKEQIRIVMADDHPIVRQGLRQIIEADPGIAIVAEAGTGREALAQIEMHGPSVAVLDVDMPDMGGFDVVRALRENGSGIGVVFLTMHGDHELFEEAIRLGVAGYVLKDSAVHDIVAGVRSVAAGRPFLSPALSGLLLARRGKMETLDEDVPGLQGLTPKERQILRLIAQEMTSREIANMLFISYRTVETHRTNICRKLGVRGNLGLVRFAATHRAEL